MLRAAPAAEAANGSCRLRRAGERVRRRRDRLRLGLGVEDVDVELDGDRRRRRLPRSGLNKTSPMHSKGSPTGRTRTVG